MKIIFLFLCANFAIFQLSLCYVPLRRPLRAGCPPIKLNNGKVKIRGRIFAQYTCNKGYILAGDKYSRCSQGQWDSDPPLCIVPNCSKIQSLKNGVIHFSHKGGVLNFYCGANYNLQGPKQAFCVDMKWTNHLPSCIPTNITPSLSCDFETEDICGWSHDLNHNFDWKRFNYRTPSGHLATGPSYDHTKGPGKNGFYMYIEGSSKNINDKARLISPLYRKETNNTCLEFYYHMYGSGIGQLNVYLKKINNSWEFDQQNAIFTMDGNQGNQWWRGLIELGTISDQFQIVFEGVRGISYISDIAIDDVKIIENCVADPATTTEIIVEESTFIYDSCINRCNTTSPQDLCNCDENCYDNNTCCPDYVAVCILTNDIDTTESVSDEYTTEMNEGVTTTSARTSVGPQWIPQTTQKQSTYRFTWIPPTKPTKTMTTSTTQAPVYIRPISDFPVETVQPTVITTTSKPTIITTTSKPTILTTISKPTSPPFIVTKSPVLTTVTKYFLNDMLPVPVETTTEGNTEIAVDEGVIPTKEYPPDDSDQPVLSDKMFPVHEKPTPTNSATVIAVLAVCFIVIAILVLVFLAKRVSCKRWLSVRRMRSGNGDSQSDVRFLTSDEILDFTIARPVNDY